MSRDSGSDAGASKPPARPKTASNAPASTPAGEAQGGDPQVGDAPPAPPVAGEGGAGGRGDRGGPVEVAIVSIGARSMWRRLGWMVAVLVILAATVGLAILVPVVSVPLLISFIIAYLLAPIVNRLERWKIRRSLGILILVFVFLGLMTAATAIVVPLVADDVRRIPAQLGELYETASAWVEATIGIDLPRTGDEVVAAVTAYFEDLEDAETLIGSVAQVVFGRTVGVLGMLLGFVMIPIFTFFLLRDLPAIFRHLRDLVPAPVRPTVVQRFGEIDSALGGFIRGQLIVAAILAVLYSIGLWLVGLPLALVVGIISGLGNMIPFVGTAIGLALATLVALLSWQGFLHLLLVYAVFAAVQALESWLITPHIVGNRVGLSPFGVIVAVLAFGELFGFLGVLLAVPLAAVIKILLAATVESYRQSTFFAHRAN
jgi:predicted PurR-regulated permease PerM